MMKTNRRFSAAVLAICLASLGVALTSCERVADTRRPGTVRAELHKDPLTLNLISTSDRYSDIIGKLVTDCLVHFDAGLAFRPGLAASWEVSPDRKTVTFNLRRGVSWHDGAPFTARDVLFTVAEVKDPANDARTHFPGLQHVSVEAPDDFTVVAHHDEPDADFLEAWWVPIIPEHLAGQDEDLLTGEFSRHPVGCGPFRFVDYRRGERLELQANPDYWGGKPSIERLVFRIYPDERTGYQALLKGEVDLMTVTPDIYREAARSSRAKHLERFEFYRFALWYVGWNQDGSNPFFTDMRVRRAMILSLDRETLSESLFAGLALPAITTIHPHSPWADPGLEPWPYDLPQARRLLEAAGWRDGNGDGVRERDGRDFDFTLMVASSTQEIVDRMAAWVQQSLAEAGVRVRIEKLEGHAFKDRRSRHQFEALMGGLALTPSPDHYELYHSSAVNQFNYVGLKDEAVDALVEQGRETFDPEQRQRALHLLQRRLHELEPISPLFHFATPVLHDPRVQGIEASPVDYWRIRPGPTAWRWVEADSGE